MCQIVLVAFGLAYIAALAVGLVGTFGWFGQERDPLGWLFILPLGLPWVLMLDGADDVAGPWLASLAPLLNLAILALFCRYLKERAA
jgi:hypothetical protein